MHGLPIAFDIRCPHVVCGTDGHTGGQTAKKADDEHDESKGSPDGGERSAPRVSADHQTIRGTEQNLQPAGEDKRQGKSQQIAQNVSVQHIQVFLHDRSLSYCFFAIIQHPAGISYRDAHIRREKAEEFTDVERACVLQTAVIESSLEKGSSSRLSAGAAASGRRFAPAAAMSSMYFLQRYNLAGGRLYYG